MLPPNFYDTESLPNGLEDSSHLAPRRNKRELVGAQEKWLRPVKSPSGLEIRKLQTERSITEECEAPVLNLGILRETTSSVVKAITKGALAPVPLFQPCPDRCAPAMAAAFVCLA